MSNLVDFYKELNIIHFEGYSQQCNEESIFLKNIVNNKSINNVMEIGFNAGHSAELFLSSNKNINLVSFDIGTHEYVNFGKKFIDRTYPGKHTLIIGNSLDTVPKYIKQENKKFDIIFIDGGHDYNVAKSDLFNCKELAHNKTIVILDDTMNNNKWINSWNTGPNRAWKEAKEMNIIKEIDSIDFSNTHGLSWGYYNL
jgi:predicted O-methyltransferase YrrM